MTRACPDGLRIEADDRLLIIAPHPDDEVLGCGGVIQRAAALGAPLRIVYATHGDGHAWALWRCRLVRRGRRRAALHLGWQRQREAVRAARRLGVPRAHLTFLGYPDGGLWQMWRRHHGRRRPYRHPWTSATAVPYAAARRPGAAFKPEELARDLRDVLQAARPTLLFAPHPRDRHGDHRALAGCVSALVRELPPAQRPVVCRYLIHHPRWPRSHAPAAPTGAWAEAQLQPVELLGKRRALQAYRTQLACRPRWLSRFVRPAESFELLPSGIL